MGEAIAANAWPARIGRDGTLYVHTSSSAWAFELAQLEAMLRERLRAHLGAAAPQRLRFAVGPLPEPPPPAVDAAAARPRPNGEELARAAELTAGIEDEDLREMVQRAAAASLAGARSDLFV